MDLLPGVLQAAIRQHPFHAVEPGIPGFLIKSVGLGLICIHTMDVIELHSIIDDANYPDTSVLTVYCGDELRGSGQSGIDQQQVDREVEL